MIHLVWSFLTISSLHLCAPNAFARDSQQSQMVARADTLSRGGTLDPSAAVESPRERHITTLVVTFPRAAARTVRQAVSLLSRGKATRHRLEPQSISVEDSELLIPLRRTLIPILAQSAKSAQSDCKVSNDTFQALLEETERKLKLIAMDGARQCLAEAKRKLEWGNQVVKRRQLVDFLMMSAWLPLVLDLHKMRAPFPPEYYLETALLMTPELEMPTDPPKELWDALERARIQVATRPRVQVQVQVQVRTSNLAGLTLLVDGEPVSSGNLQLPIGRHFLQLATPEGEAIVGLFQSISDPAANKNPLWPPLELRPPTGEETLTRLETFIREDVVDSALVQGLVSLLETKGLDELLMVVPGTIDRAPRSLIINASMRHEIQTLRPAAELWPADAGPYIAATLGGGSLVAGSVFAHSLYQLNTKVYTRESAAIMLRRRNISGVSTAVLLTGALATTYLTWLYPAERFREWKVHMSWFRQSGHEAEERISVQIGRQW